MPNFIKPEHFVVMINKTRKIFMNALISCRRFGYVIIIVKTKLSKKNTCKWQIEIKIQLKLFEFKS